MSKEELQDGFEHLLRNCPITRDAYYAAQEAGLDVEGRYLLIIKQLAKCKETLIEANLRLIQITDIQHQQLVQLLD